MSAVPPDPYAQRFIAFMKSSVFQRSQQFIQKEREKEQEEILKKIEEMQKNINNKLAGAFAHALKRPSVV